MKEHEEDYRTGFPDKAGWYDVLIDGIEARLCFRFCHSCGKYVWQDLQGIKVSADAVTWLPGSHSVYP